LTQRQILCTESDVFSTSGVDQREKTSFYHFVLTRTRAHVCTHHSPPVLHAQGEKTRRKCAHYYQTVFPACTSGALCNKKSAESSGRSAKVGCLISSDPGRIDSTVPQRKCKPRNLCVVVPVSLQENLQGTATFSRMTDSRRLLINFTT
jgi:hypothetical protein